MGLRSGFLYSCHIWPASLVPWLCFCGAMAEPAAAASSGRIWTVFFVVSWFALNISMANVTKWLFLHGVVCADGLGCWNYEFPLTMTAFDVFVGRFLSGIYMRLFLPDLPEVSLARQLRDIAPLGVCFGLSIGMGNVSLKYIFPSFNQMIGASSPLITVFMATVMGKRYNLWTWATMPIICGGLAVCVTQEMNFHWFGALSCVGAAVLRGVKSILQASLLSGEKGERKLDSVELLYYMSPWACLVLLLFAIGLEGSAPWLIVAWYPFQVSTTGLPTVLSLLLLTALNAWFLSVANLLVTHHTGPVTLQVLGNVKTCLAIMVSVAIFGNTLRLGQCYGVASCLFGVWLYGKKGREVKAEDAVSKKAA